MDVIGESDGCLDQSIFTAVASVLEQMDAFNVRLCCTQVAVTTCEWLCVCACMIIHTPK